jgi:hypothetical protein
MRWITRDDLSFDRIACCWLIARFIDYRAEILFAADDAVAEVGRTDAIAFALGGEAQGDGMSGFEALIATFGLAQNRALAVMTDAVRQAGRSALPGPMPDGLQMLARGLETLFPSTRRLLRHGFTLCDAMHAGICERIGATGWSAPATPLPATRNWAPRPGRRRARDAAPAALRLVEGG